MKNKKRSASSKWSSLLRDKCISQINYNFQFYVHDFDTAVRNNLLLLIEYLRMDRATIYLYEERECLVYPKIIMTPHGEMDPEAAISVHDNLDNCFSRAFEKKKNIVVPGSPEYAVYIPLMEDGRKLGIIKLDNYLSTTTVGRRQADEIYYFNGILLQGVNNCLTYRNFHAQIRKLTTLTKIAGVMATALRLEEILKITLTSLVKDMGYDRAHVYIMGEDSRKVVKNVSFDFREIFRTSDHKTADYPSVESFLTEKIPSFLSRKFSSDMIAYTPIYWKGKKTGILVVDNLFSRQVMKTEDLSFLGILGNQLGVLIENSRLFEKVEKFSITDGLTGLYNHRYFYERITEEMTRADRMNSKLSVLICDIDHFKKFNDKYGHQAGDQVLRTVSDIIKKCIRSIDIAARYGGEEMCVILPGADRESSKMIARRIHTGIRNAHMKIGKKSVGVTVSVGVATFKDDSGEKQDLIRKADKALYWAKEHGRNKVVLFNEMENDK